MPCRINKLALRIAPWLLTAALGFATAAGAEAPAAESNVDRLWLPSFSVFGGAMAQQMRSSVESQCALGRPEETVVFVINNRPIPQTRQACRDPSHILPPQPVTETVGNLRPPVSGSDLAVSPMVGATLQVMSPRLEVLPFAPRAFVAGELLTFWPPERQIAREGVPTGVQFPPPVSPSERPNASRYQQQALFGVGSTVNSQVQTLGWGAHAGLAFPFDFRGRRLWFKPAFGWTRFEVDVEGVVEAGLKDDGFGIDVFLGGQRLDTRRGPGIRKVSLLGNGSRSFNAIGPGLELELEVGRFGPLGVSVFLAGDAHRVLGERKVEFSASRTCDPPSNPCLSGLTNEVDFTIINNPPLTIGPEDVISPTGPVPDTGVLLPNLAPFGPFGADTYSARWSFEVDDWAYRGGVGIRMHWLGN